MIVCVFGACSLSVARDLAARLPGLWLSRTAASSTSYLQVFDCFVDRDVSLSSALSLSGAANGSQWSSFVSFSIDPPSRGLPDITLESRIRKQTMCNFYSAHYSPCKKDYLKGRDN